MMDVQQIAFISLLLSSQISSSESTCQNFWREWNERRCSLSIWERCFVGPLTSLMVNNEAAAMLQCHYRTPEMRLFQCLTNITSLKSIRMLNCNFTNFVMLNFLSYQRPSFIRLEYSQIDKVPVIIDMSGITSLSKLEIVGPRTGKIFPVTLGDLPVLLEFTVEKHNFTKFPPRYFHNVKNMKKLTVKNGQLEVLPEDLFSELAFLTTLDLSWNRINKINPKTFRSLHSLVLLDLSGNCIEEVAADVLSSLIQLEELYLSNNKLKKAPVFDWLSYHLQVLDLTDNDISIITLPIYSKTSARILLDRNKIETVLLDYSRKMSDGTLVSLLPSYSITDNPFLCDCSLENFLLFLHSREQTTHWIFTNESVHAKCLEGNLTRSLIDVCWNKECDLCSAKAVSTTIDTGTVLLLSLLFFVCTSFFLLVVYALLNRTVILPLLYSWNLYFSYCDRNVPKEAKIYDVFLCYHSHDVIVAKTIKHKLFDKNILECMVCKDGTKGFPDKDSLLGSMENSRVTIILLSTTLVLTTWFKEEYIEAHNRMPQHFKETFLPVFLDSFRRLTITNEEMIKLLYSSRQIRWGERFFWPRLKYYARTPK